MKTLTFLTLALATLIPLGAQDFDYGTYKTSVYDGAMNGGMDALRPAIQTLEGQLAQDPGRAEAMILKGSLLAKQAEVEFWFWDKLAHVNEGIDLMAKGMDRLESSRGKGVNDTLKLTLMMIRGMTSAYIPDTFQQTQVALKEMERSVKHPLWNEVPAPFRAELLGLLARHYQKSGKAQLAKETLDKARSIDAGIADKAYRS